MLLKTTSHAAKTGKGETKKMAMRPSCIISLYYVQKFPYQPTPTPSPFAILELPLKPL